MNNAKPAAIVIGAGVSGLTTAICLAEAGIRVTIWTAEPTEATTSMAAGATWGPYHVEPFDLVTAWGATTLDILRRLAAQPSTGVRLVSGIEAARDDVDPPAWGDQLDGFRMCERTELPPGFATGWRYTAPLVDMPIYLRYLQQRLADSGGQIRPRRVAALTETIGAADVVVNCAGIGARELVPDLDLFPIRGQLVVVENPGITEFFSEDTGASRTCCTTTPAARPSCSAVPPSRIRGTPNPTPKPRTRSSADASRWSHACGTRGSSRTASASDPLEARSVSTAKI